MKCVICEINLNNRRICTAPGCNDFHGMMAKNENYCIDCYETYSHIYNFDQKIKRRIELINRERKARSSLENALKSRYSNSDEIESLKRRYLSSSKELYQFIDKVFA